MEIKSGFMTVAKGLPLVEKWAEEDLYGPVEWLVLGEGDDVVVVVRRKGKKGISPALLFSLPYVVVALSMILAAVMWFVFT